MKCGNEPRSIVSTFHSKLVVPRLTERFYRIDAGQSRSKGGTGLGLAIVKHILARHRGRLAISSQLGQGSTFAAMAPLHPNHIG